MARLVILANSIRPGGSCIAGVDLATGEWARPITSKGDAIPHWRCFVDCRPLAVGDILEIDLVRPREPSPYQPENQIIRNWNWAVVGAMAPRDIARFVESSHPILHSTDDRVTPETIDKLPPGERKSLQLVRPRALAFEREPWKPGRWRATFSDERANRYSFRVTDQVITGKLERREPIAKDALLTVSLAKPWAPQDKSIDPLCYKLVAAVIELEQADPPSTNRPPNP
ncbi:MAG: hypothetical protein GX621_10170 [Pirellulaceae bacterium]|nr:hypothetical protein [Pirellulaceae bacterium]